MNRPKLHLWTTLAIIAVACSAVWAGGYEPEPDAERYAARVELLIEAHQQLFKDHSRIVERQRELQTEYAKAEAAIERLQLQAVANRIRAHGLESRLPGAWKELENWNKGLAGNQNETRKFQEAVLVTTGLELVAQELEFEAIRIDIAGRAAIEHMLACIRQAMELGKEAATLQPRYDQLQADFWALADIDGQRSREELEAALLALLLVGDDNPAGLTVRGVVELRLKRFGEAQEDFSRVIELGSQWQAVASAARGESLIAEGKSREGLSELNRALRVAKSDPRVIYFYARGLAVDGKYKNSEKAWKRLLAVGGFDAAAHRNLALLYSATEGMRPRREQALKHAEAACELTGHSDWSCLMALAAAKAAGEDYVEAADLAERASKLALGDKREICLDFAEKYNDREKPNWNWK